MSPRRFSYILCAITALLQVAAPGLGQEDVRGITLRQQGLSVIEEKCLVCHNRQRIDAAVRQRKDMEQIMRRMEKKGAVVTEKDRQVIGHFWRQQPFKTKGPETKP